MQPDLYHHGMSVCGAKARMTLAEKEVQWNSRYVNIRAGEQRDPAYLKLNPNGVVPTLVNENDVVIESTVIAEYVDETFSGPPLKPGNPMARARMRLWTKRIDESIHIPATATLSFAIALREEFVARFATHEALQENIASKPNPKNREFLRQTTELGIEAPLVRESIELFDKLFADMEAALSRGPWLTGETFSLADIGYAPYMARMDCLQLDWLWHDRPHVAGWYKQLKSRPTYTPSITDWFDEKEIDLMQKNGLKARETLQQLVRKN